MLYSYEIIFHSIFTINVNVFDKILYIVTNDIILRTNIRIVVSLCANKKIQHNKLDSKKYK